MTEKKIGHSDFTNMVKERTYAFRSYKIFRTTGRIPQKMQNGQSVLDFLTEDPNSISGNFNNTTPDIEDVSNDLRRWMRNQ